LVVVLLWFLRCGGGGGGSSSADIAARCVLQRHDKAGQFLAERSPESEASCDISASLYLLVADQG